MATFRVGEKTHQAVPPQQLALELGPADNPRIRDETGAEHRTAVPGAGHVREETLGSSSAAKGVTPDLVVRERGRESHPYVFVLDKHGFPRLRLPRRKQHFGYATGDLVRAVVPTGKKKGTHSGRVAVRATGSFNITTTHGTAQGIHHRHLRLLQRADGYAYTTRLESIPQ